MNTVAHLVLILQGCGCRLLVVSQSMFRIVLIPVFIKRGGLISVKQLLCVTCIGHGKYLFTVFVLINHAFKF